MANQGIMHLAFTVGGKPYCNSRRAIMSTTPGKIEVDGWQRVCIKCMTVHEKYKAKMLKALTEGKSPSVGTGN